MNYEIVTLDEKIVTGISARTNNTDPNMGMVIGGLWNKFYQDGVYASINNKANDKALGIYTEYAGKEKDDYTILSAVKQRQKKKMLPIQYAISPLDVMQSLSQKEI